MKVSNKTQFIVFTGVFTALAIVLYFIELPVIPGLSYLKIDLSDIPALAAAVFFGPVSGVFVELIKNIVDLFVKGFASTMGYGDLVNFLVGIGYVVPASIIFRFTSKQQKFKFPVRIIFASLTGLVCMLAAGIVFNYFIAPPFFKNFMHVTLTPVALWSAISGATILNLVKSIILSIIFAPVVALGNRLFKEKSSII